MVTPAQQVGQELDATVVNMRYIKLEQGDMVYLFSDGYADQFGGAQGKKYMYRRFRELLVEISRYPTEQQSSMLEQAFNGWRGGYEQGDDILVIGMRA